MRHSKSLRFSSSYYTYTVNWNVYFTNVSVTIQLPSSKIKVSLARIIKKFTIVSHPSHTGLFSYVCLQLGFKCCTYRSASFPGPAQLFVICCYKRSAVSQGLKSSQIHGSIRISVKTVSKFENRGELRCIKGMCRLKVG